MNEPVDWDFARRIAVRTAERHPGPPVDLGAVQASLALPALVAEPLVAAATGLRAPGPARVEVVDRAGWAAANVTAFQALLRPLLDEWRARLDARGANPRLTALSARLAGFELGTLLGLLSRRVLGQYDLLVGSDSEGGGDTVYLVGPNLVAVEAKYGFEPDEFRTWVLLHELTHRAQFTGVPWLRDHYLGLVGEALSSDGMTPAHLLDVLRSAATDRSWTRSRLAEGGVAAVVATPRQRAALAKLSGLMALLEGHGDVTMNRAGAGLVPSAERFEWVLAARRQQANPLARVIQRWVGLEAKLDQYAAGERFVATVEAAAGVRAVERCWVGPEHLPDAEEVRRPERWLSRMGLAHDAA